MSGAWAVCKREFKSFFVTPIGYIVIGVFALISGLGFSISFLFYARISENPSAFAYTSVPNFEETLLGPFMVFCGMLALFIGPLVTMRLLAEERNRGTMELLLTQPLRDRDIIFGKYGAAIGMLAIMMCVIVVYLGIIGRYTAVEPAVLAFGLLGVFLMCAAFLSLGLFVSSMCRNQISAGIITFALGFLLPVVGSLSDSMPKKNPALDSWPVSLRNAVGGGYNLLRGIMKTLPLDTHVKDMSQGTFAPKDVVYLLLFTAFFLFLTFRALESRKWRA